MPRQLSLEWPDPTPFRDRHGQPIRLLAVSDQLEPGLADARNRQALEPLDLLVGCGDLPAHDLAFIADALNVPLFYVRGNHDADERWTAEAGEVPEPIQSSACRNQAGLSVVGLSWPGPKGRQARRSESGAWGQALRLAIWRLGRVGPLVIISHVPPSGVGDVPSDPFHRGFGAYRWLLDRLSPPLWLHGHTPLAAVSDWQTGYRGSTIVNVSGAVLIELCPPVPRERP